MLFLASALAVTAPIAGAQADGVRDVMIVERGGVHVWIALDAMPGQLEFESGPGRLDVVLSGLSVADARRIIPVGGGPLRSVLVTPSAGGAQLVLNGDFERAEAELRQGGIWVALDGRLDGQPRAVAADQDGADTVQAAPSQTGGASPPDRTTRPSMQPQPQPQPPAQSARSDNAETEMALADRSAGGPDHPRSISTLETVSEGVDSSEAQVPNALDQTGPCDATAAVVQESPWDLDALTRHADCLAGQGPAARENAAGLYERVLAFDPTHFQAAIGLARIREAQGRGQEAAELYERAAGAALTDGEALAARAAADRSRDDER